MNCHVMVILKVGAHAQFVTLEVIGTRFTNPIIKALLAQAHDAVIHVETHKDYL
jgi:imidazolonepropionase-like amidohydrolase